MKRFALRGFVIFLAAGSVVACGPSADVLATFDGGSITVADYDRYVLSLPEPRRQLADDQSPEERARAILEELATRRIIEQSDRAREIAASPEMQAYRQWMRSTLLAQKLTSQLADDWQPDPAELAAEIQELQRRAETRTLYTFRHIYFRTDRASSPAEIEATRRRARKVADLARSGADFLALIREHSDSADADQGGLIGNVPPASLDDTTAGVLASMSEGEVSPVVETRTGLHIFRLERAIQTEPMAEERVASTAENALRRRQLEQQRSSLIEELRDRIPFESESSGWRIGSWEVDDLVLPFVSAPAATTADALEQQVVDRYLLAQEAIDRGLETPEIDEEVDRIVGSAVLDRCLAEVRDEIVDQVPEEQLRELYDSQPSRFADGEAAHVELIFIPQGKDGFTTQRMVEDLVAELRAGASFADAARERSTGPGADQGGDLGILEVGQWSSYGPAVLKELREIQVGTVSEPIYCSDKVLGSSSLLRGGFAVIRVKERIPESPRPFEEAIDDVRRAWLIKNRDMVTAQVASRILSEGRFEIVRLPSLDETQS